MAGAKDWINAFRLRTLPLALSSIITGSFLAVAVNQFSWLIFTLTCLTTVFLQVLSNLANDYGDSQHGTDNDQRVGPDRAVQTGAISPIAMKRAVWLFSGLSLITGLSLLGVSFEASQLSWILLFLVIGIAAIVAAIKYTMGDNPYGYAGLGDVSVFLFFGLTGVAGTYFLYTHHFELSICLPAASLGLLSTGVLNLNNLRDLENDKACGKRTLAVRLGVPATRIYHTFLLLGALCVAGLYVGQHADDWMAWLFLLVTPLIGFNLKTVWTFSAHAQLDPLLKQLALSTLLFSLLFGIGLIL